MARFPSAIWSPFPGIGPFTEGPFKIVHHTTEGQHAAGAIETYRAKHDYPHFTVEDDVVYQHVDTTVAVTALEHPDGTVETNRSHAIQIELVGFAGRPKSRRSLRTMAILCRWLEQQHGIPPVWPNGYPDPPVDGRESRKPHNRNETNWRSKGGHYGHCHVPNNHHWDPGYTAEEVALVMGSVPAPLAEAAPDIAEVPLAMTESAAGSGEAAAPSVTPYVSALVSVAEAEHAAYQGVVEGDEPLRSRIDSYCRGIGVVPPQRIAAFPWSATFVSWCVKTAGATFAEFSFSTAHAVFVRAAIANADAETGVFRARPFDTYAPRVGDLIHRNRAGGRITYDQARHDSAYPSHSAIVVEVGEDRTGRYAMTIGGNERDSIRKTRVALDPEGRVVSGPSNPVICIVQDLKVEGTGQPAARAEALATSASQRLAMATIIFGFEARLEHGRLVVYKLPADDGGGRYEVAGINERYNKALCDELVALIGAGRQDEAKRRAIAFMADETDAVAGWTNSPGIEFYLRDCLFNRGSGGATWILQRAVGVDIDQRIGPRTLAAVARDEARPLDLLAKLRQAREAYERLRRDESSRYWVGLVNRWDRALEAAKSFLPGDSIAGSSEQAAEAAMPVAARSEPAFEPPSGGRGSGSARERDAPLEAVAGPPVPEPDEAAPFSAPESDPSASLPGALPWSGPPFAAASVLRRPSAVGEDLLAFHAHLEAHLFQRPAQAAFRAEAVAPPPVEQMIVGVGIGTARRDFESVGPAGPGAPVLNVYVTEAMSMDRVKAVLVDRLGMRDLASDRHPVNVLYPGPIHARSNRHRERPSPCGLSVGHYLVTAGTQGVLARALTEDRQNRLLMLSNNHVLANENDGQPGDAIYQPGRIDVPDSRPDLLQVGVLERWVPLDFSDSGVNFVDCATAWCWPDRVRKDFIRQKNGGFDYFTVGSRMVQAARGMPVGKSGRTTQLTSGQIIDVSASISVGYGGGKVANFRDQITIQGPAGQPFSDGGDSGSLIWTWNEDRSPVGLLFAGGRDLTFANRIEHVLDALKIALFT